eukprot:5540761-Prymnesium_polylepis.1
MMRRVAVAGATRALRCRDWHLCYRPALRPLLHTRPHPTTALSGRSDPQCEHDMSTFRRPAAGGREGRCALFPPAASSPSCARIACAFAAFALIFPCAC